METVTDRKDLARRFRSIADAYVANPPGDATRYWLRSTSGTTGSGPMHILHEVAADAPHRYDGMHVLLVFLHPMSMRLINAHLVRYGKESKQKLLCVDMKDAGPELAHIIEDLAPDAAFGLVSYIVAARARMGEALASVRTLRVVGEFLTTALAQALAAQFPRATIGQVYASSELAQISKNPCPHLGPNTYHVFDDIDIDIEHPDEQGVGAIVLSRRLYNDISVSRYRIGDSGRLTHESCTCGERRTLQVMGRSGYDYIKVAGAVLRKEEFDRVLAAATTPVSDYRAEVYSVYEAGRLVGGVVLTVYRNSGPLTDAEISTLARRVCSALFVTPTQTLGDLIEQGIFKPLSLVVSREPFSGAGKKVKLRMRS